MSGNLLVLSPMRVEAALVAQRHHAGEQHLARPQLGPRRIERGQVAVEHAVLEEPEGVRRRIQNPRGRSAIMSAAGPTQGANYSPSGGSAAATAASVGVQP